MAAVEEHRSDAQTKVSSKVKERKKRKFEALLVKQTSRADNGAISRALLPPKNIASQEARALRDLAKDEDILAMPADKGQATVVMD